MNWFVLLDNCVVTVQNHFLFQGAYIALNDNDFGNVGLKTVPSRFCYLAGDFRQSTSSKIYSDKYNTILKVYTDPRVESLDALAEAVIAGAENGPFNDILNTMDDAVKPGLSKKISPGRPVFF